MSESAVRKLQPFTVGTRLSLPKCTDLDAGPGMATLDNGSLHRNLNDRVSLYLARAQAAPSPQPRFSPPVAAAVRRRSSSPPEGITEEDRINRNALAARAIKKITLSNWQGVPPSAAEEEQAPGAAPPSSEKNLNNNNSRASRDLPRIAGMHRENRPKAQVKVFLRKGSEEEEMDIVRKEQRSPRSGATRLPLEIGSPFHMDLGCSSASPTRKDSLKKQEPSSGMKSGARGSGASPSLANLSSHIAQFNREIFQAETWVRGKLRDLKDGCDVQLAPLQDWESSAQALQRDMKDFENTVSKLSQMGEHLISKQTPNTDNMIKQLQALKDQWHVLKQTATNQSKALGGARNLQEFTRKADQLEAWIREKEEQPCMSILPEESSDKIHLARRILDLKQEQQRFQNLQEQINSLAQKLEKQGRNESKSKSISARRKHINKLWLRVQGTLMDQHSTLQLALEAASFYQQADTILRAMDAKRRVLCSLSTQADQEGSADRDLRDIASQIMMLDVAVSQLISLHPELAARVTQKHRQVKDSWGHLQQAVREDRSALRGLHPAFSREADAPATPGSVGKQQLGSPARGGRTEPRAVAGSGLQRDDGVSAEERTRLKEQAGLSPARTAQETGSDVISGRHNDHKRKKKPVVGQAEAQKARPQPEAQLHHFCQAAAQALCWLRENISSSAQWDRAENAQNLGEMQKQQEALQQEILWQETRIEAVQQEGKGLVRLEHPGSPRVEGILRELERLWDAVKKRSQDRGTMLQETGQARHILEELTRVEEWLQRLTSSLSEPAVMRDPELIRRDLQEAGSLETELSTQGISLRTLREQTGRMPAGRGLLRAEKIQRRLETVEGRFASAKDALKRRASDLRDSLVLSEFLQNVQMEEQLNQRNAVPAVNRRLDFREPLRLIPLKEGQKQVTSENVEELARPLDELQEAVDMLNDAVEERERAMAAEKETGCLAHLLADASRRISSAQSQAEELGRNILETERDFALVKSELGLGGLHGLQAKQQEMEFDVVESLKAVIGEVEKQAVRLEELCPSQLENVGAEIQGTLQAWAGLEKTVQDNKAKLQRASRLQAFFRNYLAMISWTEDTRTQVFSEGVDTDGLPTAQKEELGRKIEVKFKEFEELADAGWRLIAEEHYLTETIKERIEELQSMLGWVLVRWRAQKRQKNLGNRKDKKRMRDGQGEMGPGKADAFQDWCTEPAAPEAGGILPQQPRACFQEPHRPAKVVSTLHERREEPMGHCTSEDFQDPLSLPRVQESQEDPEAPTFLEGGSPQATLVLDPLETPVVVVPQPGIGSLGGTVNLILNISRKGEKKQQVQAAAGVEAAEAEDGLHRVCTYLHVKDTEKERRPACHSLTMPRSTKKSPSKACSSPESSSGNAAARGSGAAFHTLPKISPNSLFNSLKRKEKAKPKAQRMTIQKIMGVNANGASSLPEKSRYHMSTWPLKRCRKKERTRSPALGGFLGYMKNPLVKDIDAECGAIRPASNVTKEEFRSRTVSFAGSKPALVNHGCRHLSLGSVLSLELPKDLSLLGNFQDNIKVAPQGPERREGTRQDVEIHLSAPPLWGTTGLEGDAKVVGYQKRRPEMESETSERPAEPREAPKKVLTHDKDIQEHSSLSEEVNPTLSVPRQKMQGLGLGMPRDDRLMNTGQRGSTEDLMNFRLNRLSSISVLHEQMDHEWHRLAARWNTPSGHVGSSTETQASSSLKLKEILTSKRRANSPNRFTVRAVPGIASESAAKEVLNPDHLPIASFSQGCDERRTKGSTDSSQPCQQIQVDIKPSSQLSVLEYEFCKQDYEHFIDIKPLSSIDRTDPPVSAENAVRIKQKSLPLVSRQTTVEAFHPNHELFEEDEEELEDIWKNVERCKGRRCKEVVHMALKIEAGGESTPDKGSDEPHCQDIPGGQMIMTSAPNVLVAKFTLPSSAQIHQKLERKGDTSDHQDGTAKSSEAWASFSYREETKQRIHLVKETLSGLAEASCVEDQITPMYKYQEAEKEHASTAKNPNKRDFQLMEGTLEKKHMLQPGGRKATCRTWSKCHAVLVRRTLCLYQDRKDPIKSSTGAIPLNLVGAVCSLEMEYTKKTNCFRLQMQDGSEVLLRAPSGALMREWVSKIQQNSGFDEEDFFHAAGRPPEGTSSPTRGAVTVTSAGRPSSARLSGYPSPVRDVAILSRPSTRLQWPPGKQDDAAEAGAFQRDDPRSIQHTVAQRVCQWAPAGSPRLRRDSCHEDEDPALVTNQRRSRSFTSATYQKVTPVSLPAEAFEAGGSYSVTLYIGDQSSPAQRARCHSAASQDPSLQRDRLHQLDWQTEVARDDLGERSPGASTPTKNKSVFKKFFRKKD